jgi:seryl-tRNA synthetase
MAMRFRARAGAKAEIPHTLNASGVALPRTFASLLENHQTERGPCGSRRLCGRIWTGSRS